MVSASTDSPRRSTRRFVGVTALLALLAAGSTASHSPVPDGSMADWCAGVPSNDLTGGARIEDTGAELTCGTCQDDSDLACVVDSDCFTGPCVNDSSRVELVWWDHRTDAAINDLSAAALTQDATNLYVVLRLWVDPDPVQLPVFEIALDFAPGGLAQWHDPNGALVAPGHCSLSTDRGCTSNADCHFCAVSQEPPPSTRVRACGSGCDPDIPTDVCLLSETCVDLGVGGVKQGLGLGSSPPVAADLLLVLDTSRWLVGVDGLLVMEPGTSILPDSPWDPVTGCPPDEVGDNDWCDFSPTVNPGAAVGPGGPPGVVEMAIPWGTALPGLGPGQEVGFTTLVARGNFTLDYSPDGAIEDVLSEAVDGYSTTTTSDCPGFGLGNTLCEIADGSSDAFIPGPPPVPGGRTAGLQVAKGVEPSITLSWEPSCSAADTDYSIYEGSIGSPYDHLPVPGHCSTAGLATATFNAAPGDRYYLVVPTDGATEGSYGASTAAPERPASGLACAGQSLGLCTENPGNGPVCDNCRALEETVYECHHRADDTDGAACSRTECIENVLKTDTCDHHPAHTRDSTCGNQTSAGALVVQKIRKSRCPAATVAWDTWHTVRFDECRDHCDSVRIEVACETTAANCAGKVVRGPFNRGKRKKCGCP